MSRYCKHCGKFPPQENPHCYPLVEGSTRHEFIPYPAPSTSQELSTKTCYEHLETEIPDMREKTGDPRDNSRSKSSTIPLSHYRKLKAKVWKHDELHASFEALRKPYVKRLKENTIEFKYHFSTSVLILNKSDYYTYYSSGVFTLLNPILELCQLNCHYQDISTSHSADFALQTGPYNKLDNLLTVTAIDSSSGNATSSSIAVSDTTPLEKKQKLDKKTRKFDSGIIGLVEFKLSWKLTPEDKLDLVKEFYNGPVTTRDNIILATTNAAQKCFHQLVCNMHIKQVRYGVVTTHKHTYLMRLSVSEDGPILEVSQEFDRTVSMFQVYFYLALLLGNDVDSAILSTREVGLLDTFCDNIKGSAVDGPNGEGDSTIAFFLQGPPLAVKNGQSVWRACIEGAYLSKPKSWLGNCRIVKLTNVTDYEMMISAESEVKIFEHLGQTDFSSILDLVVDKIEIQGYIYHAIILQDSGISLDKLPILKLRKLKTAALASLRNLHRKGVIHGDIRLPNFVFDAITKRVRIIDFGESYIMDNTDSEFLRLCGEEIEELLEIFRTLE